MNKDNVLSKKEAAEYLGLDEKTFENYFRNAREFPYAKISGRFKFKESDLKEWREGYKWRTISLNIDDYALCLDFALAQHFRGYVLSDFGTARQREFGQKITNWVKGQLAEVAVKKFLANNFGIDVKLDFDIHGEIVPQDIIGVKNNGGYRDPKINVGIKASKPKSAFLVLGENEVLLAERRSDIYIFCRPDIPDDHLLRITQEEVIKLVKGQPHFPTYKDQMPRFENIPCEIAGYCRMEDLDKVKKIPGQEFDGVRFVKESGLLHKSRKDWEALVKRL